MTLKLSRSLAGGIRAPSNTHGLSCQVWQCKLSRPDSQTGAFCVWSVSECVHRRRANLRDIKQMNIYIPYLPVKRLERRCHRPLTKIEIARWRTARVIISLFLPNQSQRSSLAVIGYAEAGRRRPPMTCRLL